jgi:hypothetical protein
VNEPDHVLSGLARLPLEVPSPTLSKKIRTAAVGQLVPARVHPVWSLIVAASIVVYLGWALIYTGQIG